MTKPMDRRARYTRRVLQETLIAQMQEKPLNRITIREICELADVNRSTFYVYYKDMYDLMDEIEGQTYQEIDAIFDKLEPSVQDMEQFLNYIQENQLLFRCLFSQGSGFTISRFSTILNAHYGKSLGRHLMEKYNRTIADPYLYEFLYAGILGVLQKWLQNDCQDDAEQVAELIWWMIVRSYPTAKNK